MGLFRLGDFPLHSGGVGHYKIECDALTDEDWACLAFMLAERLPAFGSVEGIPRGGLKLAQAMEKYVCRYLTFVPLPHLIVDDVLTTGTSMIEARSRYPFEGAGMKVIGAVVFARNIPPVDWIFPLFRLAPRHEPC